MFSVEFIEDLREGDIIIYDTEQNHFGYVRSIDEDYDDNDETYYKATIVWFDGHPITVWQDCDISEEPLRVIRA